ncbi:MAG: spore coat associated protein CotJA [Clostridiales bacterium]|nr:spore coat associated protein CotJA [Clostridiales bacterium]
MTDGMPYSMERMPIAMAYVPWQHFARTYDLDQALQIGTIFPELNKPFTGRGGHC